MVGSGKAASLTMQRSIVRWVSGDASCHFPLCRPYTHMPLALPNERHNLVGEIARHWVKVHAHQLIHGTNCVGVENCVHPMFRSVGDEVDVNEFTLSFVICRFFVCLTRYLPSHSDTWSLPYGDSAVFDSRLLCACASSMGHSGSDDRVFGVNWMWRIHYVINFLRDESKLVRKQVASH